MTSVNVLTGENILDYLHMVFNKDGRVTAVCSDQHLRDTLQIERLDEHINFWFATPEESTSLDPSGVFKVPKVPQRRRKVAKARRYEKSQMSENLHSKGRIRKNRKPSKITKFSAFPNSTEYNTTKSKVLDTMPEDVHRGAAKWSENTNYSI